MPGAENKFIGLANFKKALFGASDVSSDSHFFWMAFRNNVLAVLVTVPGQLILGLLLAVLINGVKFGRNVYKVLFYIAVISDWVVLANIFTYIFQSEKAGLVNFLLLKAHLIKEPVMWLQNTWSANAVIWIFCIWKGMGWVMVIYTAALQGISKDMYEAAEIDGANIIQQFFNITIPAIKGTTFFILINLTNGAMNIFPQVFLITKGGPMGTTDVLLDYTYNHAFSNFEFGYAAAVSIMTGLFVFAIAMFGKKYLRYGQLN
jgi:multiple sugar transport system permease protein